MPSTINQIGLYLTNVVFGIAILLLILRFLLGVARANFYNPLSQMIVKVTDPLVLPLRKIIPPIGRFDTALILLIIVLKLVHLFLKTKMLSLTVPAIVLISAAIGMLLNTMLLVYFVAIIIMVIFSWLSMAGTRMPADLASILNSLVSPILQPIRRVMPNLGGLDLSPMIAIVGIEVIRIAIRPLYQSLAGL